MASMNWIDPCNLRLGSRNEGKIKSYESCRDVRAWSHDLRKRDRYLREWIKSDMPICVLPTSTIARFMRTMTCRSRCRATPRCHPDCKSKVILESICNSCHAMKKCFKNEEDFEKFFDDEEFETSHWPCERCLEALKSIKMLWKIIIEKIFNVNIPKQNDSEQRECCRSDSVRSVAKVWQSEMVQQAMYVRNTTPYCNRTHFPDTCIWKGTKTMKKVIPPCKQKSCDFEDRGSYDCRTDINKGDCIKNHYTIKSFKVKSTDTDCLSNPTVSKSNKTCCSSRGRKQSRQCSARVKTADISCGTCNEVLDQINAYKQKFEILQEKCNCQKKEIEKLRRENNSLRVELQNTYKNCSWKSSFHTPAPCTSNNDAIVLLPKPFECCPEENVDTHVKGVDSEMIITMKNCKNETYTHISLLQVLHKTNDPNLGVTDLTASCCQKEDPIELLTKVQNTFGAIVKREMFIANEKNKSCRKSDIDATFHKMNASKSAPSCSTITIHSSESNCLSFD